MPPSLFREIAEATGLEIAGQDIVLVVSHDCDVVHESFEKEPFVELVRCRPAQPDGNLEHAKNPRRLQFPVEVEGASATYEISIHDKVRVDRRILIDVAPDQRILLQDNTRAMIAEWVARRYTRTALPDAFNMRLGMREHRQLRERIKRLLERYGSEITGVYILLSPDRELEETAIYRAIVRMTVETRLYDSPERIEELDVRLRTPFEDLLNAFTGIKVDNCALVAEADFSLEEFKSMKRLEDWDSLSFADSEDT